jgi:hypothetical protein
MEATSTSVAGEVYVVAAPTGTPCMPSCPSERPQFGIWVGVVVRVRVGAASGWARSERRCLARLGCHPSPGPGARARPYRSGDAKGHGGTGEAVHRGVSWRDSDANRVRSRVRSRQPERSRLPWTMHKFGGMPWADQCVMRPRPAGGGLGCSVPPRRRGGWREGLQGEVAASTGPGL